MRRSFSISSPARFAASTHAIHKSGSATRSDTTPMSRAIPCMRCSSTSVVLSTTKVVAPNFVSSSPISPGSWLCSGWPVKIFFGSGALSTAPRWSRAVSALTRASDPGMSQPETSDARSMRAT